MPDQLKFIRDTIYSLKRKYGVSLDLYKISSVSNNITSGSRTITKTKYNIRRAAILPESYIKSKVYSLSYIAANKNFTYGALFNKNVKAILIDRKDLPRNIEIGLQDYINIDQKRFAVKESLELEMHAGYILICEFVDGLQPEAIYQLNIVDSIRFTQAIAIEV